MLYQILSPFQSCTSISVRNKKIGEESKNNLDIHFTVYKNHFSFPFFKTFLHSICCVLLLDSSLFLCSNYLFFFFVIKTITIKVIRHLCLESFTSLGLGADTPSIFRIRLYLYLNPSVSISFYICVSVLLSPYFSVCISLSHSLTPKQVKGMSV